jgi:hypothetical protein
MRLRVFVAAPLLGLVFPAALQAQTSSSSPPLESPNAKVAALEVALYNAQANVIEASDTARAVLGTLVLDSTLSDRLGPQLVTPETVRAVARSESPGDSPVTSSWPARGTLRAGPGRAGSCWPK